MSEMVGSSRLGDFKNEYRVRQRGCSLTHSARTPPAVNPGITIWVDEIEIEIGWGVFFEGGGGQFVLEIFKLFLFVFRRN